MILLEQRHDGREQGGRGDHESEEARRESQVHVGPGGGGVGAGSGLFDGIAGDELHLVAEVLDLASEFRHRAIDLRVEAIDPRVQPSLDTVDLGLKPSLGLGDGCDGGVCILVASGAGVRQDSIPDEGDDCRGLAMLEALGFKLSGRLGGIEVQRVSHDAREDSTSDPFGERRARTAGDIYATSGPRGGRGWVPTWQRGGDDES